MKTADQTSGQKRLRASVAQQLTFELDIQIVL